MYQTFKEYWANEGCRIQVESHEKRARLAWKACEQKITALDSEITALRTELHILGYAINNATKTVYGI